MIQKCFVFKIEAKLFMVSPGWALLKKQNLSSVQIIISDRVSSPNSIAINHPHMIYIESAIYIVSTFGGSHLFQIGFHLTFASGEEVFKLDYNIEKILRK
jgi:hypothetical protein